MTIAKTMNGKDLKLAPPPATHAEQRKDWDAYYAPRNEAFQKANLTGTDLVSGNTSASCTIISAASGAWMRTSAAC